jgi:hypothetical protein
MNDDPEQLRSRIDALQKEVTALKQASPLRGVRKRSEISIAGMPLYDIAFGPDVEKGERRGHARGFIAIGDIATGVIAVGGIARGVVSLGGCSFGVLAIGGAAIGAIALGGAAIGLVAIGGASIGYYACGGAALGKHVISGAQQDPEAIRFFKQWVQGD